MTTFAVEEVLGEEKALEVKCKLYGMEYTKADEPTKVKGSKFTKSMKSINKIVNGKPIKDKAEFQRLFGVVIEEEGKG